MAELTLHFELNLLFVTKIIKITILWNVSMVTYIIRSPLTFNRFNYHKAKVAFLTKCDKHRLYINYELQEWMITYVKWHIKSYVSL